MPNNYMDNLFTGNIMPMQRPHFQSPPIYPDNNVNPEAGKFKLGRSERGFIKVKIYVQAPTERFPSAIKIGFMGGKGSCFTMVSLQDLQGLVSFLETTITDIQALLPRMQELDNKFIQAREAFRQVYQISELANQLPVEDNQESIS